MATPMDGLKRAKPDEQNEHLIDQKVAGYLPPEEGPFHCRGCEYMLLPHSCQLVKGFIDPEGCCNLYSKD